MKAESISIIVNELIDKCNLALSELCKIKSQTPSKYVIANDIYHYRGEGYGIKDTGLVVTCIVNIHKVKLFDTYKEAYDNIDFYLVNGRGKPIELKAITVDEYFQKCKQLYDEEIQLLKNFY